MSMHKKIKNKKNALKGNKKIGSIKNLRKIFAEPLSKNKDDLRLVSTKVQRSANLGDKYEKVNLIRIKKKCIEKSRQEKSKTFLTMIEQRLDSTLLRLMHFKPTHVKHSLSRRKSEGDRNTGYKKPKNLVCANPLSSFTPFQVKQMISHGRVFINDQKVKSNNFQIKPLDKIQIKGFVKKISNSKTYKNQELSVEKYGKVYPKNLKEKKSCLSLLKKGLKKAGLTNRKKDQIAFKN
jgi:ribosomal protein S4